MIILGFCNIFFSLPFFQSFTVSEDALNAIKTVCSFLAQINTFFNLTLLIQCFIAALGIHFAVALFALIRNIL